MVFSFVPLRGAFYSFGKSGDVGGQLQRLAVLRHAEVGGINVAWPMDRRGHANFLRLQHRDRSSARPRIVQQVPSQLLQVRPTSLDCPLNYFRYFDAPNFFSNCNLRCAILFDQQSLLLENIRDFILTIMRKGNAF